MKQLLSVVMLSLFVSDAFADDWRMRKFDLNDDMKIERSELIAAGCSITIKPSEETPATAIAIGKALMEAGLPAGVLNIVFGVPSEVSEHLLASPIPRKLSFTGSVPVGIHLQKLAAQNLIRCTMELGGHSPVMIFKDADIEAAVKHCAAGKFRNAGQVCISPTRFFIEEPVYDEFIKSFKSHVEAINVGDGLDSKSTMGPLVADRRLEVMEDFISDAVSSGGEVISGGGRGQSPGSFFEPTLIRDVPDTAKIMIEEPFGPVAPSTSFSSIDEIIERANNNDLGLCSYVYTNSMEQAHRASELMESGTVAVNTAAVAVAEAPFGGIKDSGYGKEAGIESIKEYTRIKNKIIQEFKKVKV